MLFGKTGRECRLNVLKITPGHGGADIDPVGMESFESTLASPESEKPGIVEKGQQKVLVIACQGDDESWLHACGKWLDHAHRARTGSDVIDQESRQAALKGARLRLE